jgi:hypothetical protein
VGYTSYLALCDEAEAAGHIIKLSHNDDSGWGLQLLVGPDDQRSGWRAAGVVFPDFDELDEQSRHLLRWLRAACTTT